MTENAATTETPSKAQQARDLTGPQTGHALSELRSGLLIAKHASGRVYWAKSLYPTLEAASEALQAAGLPAGLDFTQYRAAGAFYNLAELIAATGDTPAPVAAGDPAPAEAEKPAPAKPTESAEARAMKVAKATRLKGVTVESRQAGKRHVLILTDGDGARLLSYVDALQRGEGFRLHVQDYGSERRLTVATVEEAAAAVMTSARLKPKAKKAAPEKAAAPKKATPKKARAKKAAPVTETTPAETEESAA